MQVLSSLSESLDLFQKVLVEEFLRELEFYLAVSSGRAQDRADFTDKLIALGKSWLLQSLGSFPLPGTNWLVNGLECAIDWANDSRKATAQAYATSQAFTIDYDRLRIILETVAMEAARRYQFWIAQLSENPIEGVVPFAKTGVERMLQYAISHQFPLNETVLLEGLMAGESGGFVSGYRNTALKVREDTRQTAVHRMKHAVGLGEYTAEGAYGRSALQTSDGTFWVLTEKAEIAHKKELAKLQSKLPVALKIKPDTLLDYGYVNLLDKDPKYGFVAVPRTLRDSLYGHISEAQASRSLNMFSSQFQEKFKDYQPICVTVSRKELTSYLSNKKKYSSLQAYLKETRSNSAIERVFYVAENKDDWDLTALNFEGADLSNGVFNHCKIGGSLKKSCWNNSYLRGADFSQVKDATDASFDRAHLEFLQAKNVNFARSTFIQTHFDYANLTNANITRCDTLGAMWARADLTGIKTKDLITILSTQTHQQNQLTEQQEEIQRLYQQLQDQQDVLNQLREQLATSLTTVQDDQDAGNLSFQLLQEQQARWELERYCQLELLQLKASFKENQQQNKAVNSALQKQIKELELQSMQLKEDFHQTLQEQQQALKQLTDRVDAVEVRVDVLAAQVKSHVVTYNHSDLPRLTQRVKEILKNKYYSFSTIKGLFGQETPMQGSYVNLRMVYPPKLITIKQKQEKNDAVKVQAESEKDKDFQRLDQKEQKDERLSSFETMYSQGKALGVVDLFQPYQELFKEEAEKGEVSIVGEKADEAPRLLVPQGRAGIGKTTFVRFASSEWAHGRLWNEYECLFMIPLRTLREEKHRLQPGKESYVSLMEFLFYTCLDHSGCSIEEFKALWNLQLEQQALAGKVLIVLDGWDELPNGHRAESVLRDLIGGTYQRVPKIITSRPYGLGQLPQQKRELEVIGFTNENIERYALNFFQDNQEKCNQFICMIKANPNVWGTAHIPVTLNVLCGLYESAEEQAVDFAQLNTLSSLYVEIQKKLIERAIENEHFNKQAIIGPVFGKKQREKKIEEYFAKHIAFLELLAYRGLKAQQIILPPELIIEAMQSIGITEGQMDAFMKEVKILGFIKPVIDDRDVEDDNDKRMEFIHLTFQEYFMGKHLARAFKEKEESEFLERARTDQTYQIVLWFMIGLLKEDQAALKAGLATLFRSHHLSVRPGIKGQLVTESSSVVTMPVVEAAQVSNVETHDLLGDYEASLWVRCVEESWNDNNLEEVQPYLDKIKAQLRWWSEVYIHNDRLFQEELFDFKKSAFIQMIDISPKVCGYLEEIKWTGMPTVKQITFFREVGVCCLSVLLTALEGGNENVRRAAAEALVKLGETATTESVMNALVAALKNSDKDVQLAVTKALIKLGERAATESVINALVAAFKSKNKDMMYAAAEALGRLGKKAATELVINALVVALKSGGRDVKYAAAQALGRLGERAATESVVNALVAALKDDDAVAHSVTESLVKLGETTTLLNALVVGLKSGNFYVQRAAVKTLVELSETMMTESAVNALVATVTTVKSNFGNLKTDAIRALGRLGEKAATVSVINALVVALKDSEYRVQCAAVEALRKLGERAATEPVINALVVALKNSNKHLRCAAAETLGELGERAATEAVINALVVMLKSSNKNMKCAAAVALGKLGERAATESVINALVVALKDKEYDVRRATAAALGKLGERAATESVINALVVALKDSEYQVQSAAVEALGKLDRTETTAELAVNALVRILKSTDMDGYYIREDAAVALEKLSETAVTESVVNALVVTLKSSDVYERRAVAEMLGKLGERAVTESAVNALVAALKDSEYRVRSAAAEALGKLGERAATESVINALIAALKDNGSEVRSATVGTLRKLGERAATEPVINALVAVLKDDNKYEQSIAADALVELGERAAAGLVINALISALKESSEHVRLVAAMALGKLDRTEATAELVVNVLVGVLKSSMGYGRYVAAQELGKLDGKAVTEPVINALVAALKDMEYDMRRAAAEALGNLGERVATESVIDVLVVALKDSEYQVQCAAAEALGKLGERAATELAVNALLAALKDRRYDVQCAAAEALGKLGERAATEPVINVLLAMIKGYIIHVKRAATEALRKLGETATTALVINVFISALKDSSENVRNIVGEVLKIMIQNYNLILTKFLKAPFENLELLAIIGFFAIGNSILLSIEQDKDQVLLVCKQGKQVDRYPLQPSLVPLFKVLFESLKNLCQKEFTGATLQELTNILHAAAGISTSILLVAKDVGEIASPSEASAVVLTSYDMVQAVEPAIQMSGISASTVSDENRQLAEARLSGNARAFFVRPQYAAVSHVKGVDRVVQEAEAAVTPAKSMRCCVVS